MELADLVVINKADLDEAVRDAARAQITSALRLFGQHGHPGACAPPRRPWLASAGAAMSALQGERRARVLGHA